MREIHERNRDIADFDFSLPEFLMRKLQEIFQKAKAVVDTTCCGAEKTVTPVPVVLTEMGGRSPRSD